MAHPLILIDTSVWIHVLGPRSVPALRERVSTLVLENEAAITMPVMFELLRGARTGPEGGRLRGRLQSLHLFAVSEADWVNAAEWCAMLAAKGLTASSIDALIAYEAIAHKATLLHADRGFDRMAALSSLRVESWADRLTP